MKGFVSKIQHYSTKDGPGIRSTVFMMGCNLRCLWCSNPEAMLPGYKLMHHVQKCQRCGSCVARYPEAITFNEEGLTIDRFAVDFDELVDLCPFDAYEKTGYWIESDELVRQLVRNRSFYQSSEGGVTFSGGECLLQSEFVEECMDMLHQQGISVCIDTAGNVPWEKAEKVFRKCDVVLYDVKAYDSELHRELTSVDNALILENLKKLDELGKKLYVRMIVVPGKNDMAEDLKNRIDFVRDLHSLVQIDFLKYHNLGEGKYHELGLEYHMGKTPEFNEELLREMQEYAGDIKTTVGG